MEGASKSNLVGWDKVCAPMANGGLGIRKMTIFNITFLGNGPWWVFDLNLALFDIKVLFHLVYPIRPR